MSFISSRPKGALTFLAFALLPFAANAQISDGKSSASDCSTLATHAERDDCAKLHAQYYTIYLHNVANEDEASQIMTAVRNTSDPTVRGYVLSSRNAIALDTYPAEYTRIEALVRSLDRPHKAYRLAYTITELDGEKTVSTQHISMVAVLGQHTSIKEGDKIPLATGSSGGGNTQFTYIDVGMNFDATIEEQGEGVTLKSKVEQSSVGPTNTIAGVQEPVIRQTVLENTAILTLGKPLMLGSIDVPTTTRRFDIAVVLESIK
jgi:type II secretory pathway component GspD/PulD (secretin)